MPKLTNPPVLTADDIHSSSSTQKHALGAYAENRFGRGFRYCQAGSSALVVGNMIQSAAFLTNHANCSVTATATGAFSIAVTPGATAGAANLYAEGLVVVSTTPGLGESYTISRHAAITASTEFTLHLMRDSPIKTALTTSSKVDLAMNPYKNVIQLPATETGPCIGVAVHAIAANEFGWVQVRGVGSVLIAGTPAIGLVVGTPTATAGAATGDDAATAGFAAIGTMLHTGVDGKCKPVFLNIN